MLILLLKVGAAASIAWSVLGFSPTAEDCECKAKADAAAFPVVPRADDCECKAQADAGSRTFVPHADDCECKAKA